MHRLNLYLGRLLTMKAGGMHATILSHVCDTPTARSASSPDEMPCHVESVFSGLSLYTAYLPLSATWARSAAPRDAATRLLL
jgi:hypothetical protein